MTHKHLNNVDIKDCVGKVLKTKNYGCFKIVSYVDNRNVHIEFIDTGFNKICNMKEVRTGSIKDESLPTVCGKGFIGSKYKSCVISDDGRKVNTREYEVWRGMLRRCYSLKERYKFPTYKGCEVSDNFCSYEYFYEWCNKQVGFDKKFNLDKDLLVKGNKIYHEDLCVFVPPEINSLIVKNDKIRGKYPIGVHFDTTKKKFVAQINRNKDSQDYLGQFENPDDAFRSYKAAKEEFIKEVAYKWKDSIDERAYNALMNYQVEITD